MAGVVNDVAEFITGNKARAAEEAQKKITAQQNALALQGQAVMGQGLQGMQGAIDQSNAQSAYAQGQGKEYDAATKASMGGSAAEYMQKANTAAQGQASQEAAAASSGAARAALKAARTSGMNKGQAAMMGGQSGAGQFAGAYQGGLQAGRNQYQGATQQFANQGQNFGNRALQATGQAGGLSQGMAGIGANTATANFQAAAGGANQQQRQGQDQAGFGGEVVSSLANSAVSSIASGATSMSDENCKENISYSMDSLMQKVKGKQAGLTPDLNELLAKVKPVDFNYKADSGEDPTKNRKGILAQDLEKTSMKDNVIDTPKGKQIDIGQQTLSNTNLIIQLASELYELKAKMKERGM